MTPRCLCGQPATHMHVEDVGTVNCCGDGRCCHPAMPRHPLGSLTVRINPVPPVPR